MVRSVKRPYDSTHRRAQAQETRRRIIRVARDLFIARGYGQTTLAQIAEAAGVAVETVYAAFRNKPALLRQVWFVESRGDEEEVTLFDRAEMQAVLAEPDLATRIRRHAGFVTEFNRRMSPLLAAITGAAASERGAEAMLDEWAQRRLDVATRYATAAASTGQLAIGMEECRDILYATMDGVLWQRLVGERGWSDERYAEWLASLWLSLFVDVH
ncbi:MAG TPA: TetR family transcriptional regulator [Acidimicrobiia bacterium]|nr:TetR family transcriptional regulator [Acidimicrobiia bacterium]